MLIRIVRMTFQPEKTEAFLQEFNKNKEAIRHFPGCSHLTLMQDYTNPSVYITYSHWEDEKALDAYRQSDLFAEVWKNTKVHFADRPVAFSMKKHTEVA